MIIQLILGVIFLSAFMGCLAQDALSDAGLLRRRYRDGERLSYLMKGRNNDQTYQVQLTAVVKKRLDGQFFEEYAWSELSPNGALKPLTAASREFRQAVTL